MERMTTGQLIQMLTLLQVRRGKPAPIAARCLARLETAREADLEATRDRMWASVAAMLRAVDAVQRERDTVAADAFIASFAIGGRS